MSKPTNLNTSLTFALSLCLLLVFPLLTYGQNPGAYKHEGDKYFDAGSYRSALSAYRQGSLELSKNKQVRLSIGICLYEINDVDGALSIFNALIKEGKTEAEVFLYQAKCLQSKNHFTDAIASYKKFLQRAKSKDLHTPWVKDEIIRCGNGARLKYGDELAYVENAGTSINTQFAEFGVKTSPTTIDKVYFNSDREDIAGGKRPNGNVDIYGTSLTNGRWTTPTPLPSNINSAGYDEVRGFSSNGQILYYVSASARKYIIRTDTFSLEAGEIRSGSFKGPSLSEAAATDLVFFNDSICLFTSNMPGGFGGYDIYISILKKGLWTQPNNLGSAINTFYDERHPFLTKDGLTLFFSSNNLKSIGGLDVFSSTFDPDNLSWSQPKSLGIPINSSLEDAHFVLSPDGMTAYLNSNRKEGYGDHDIYRILFKQPVTAHQQISLVPTFYHSIRLAGINIKNVPKNTVPPVEIKEYYISHLFYSANTEILSPQNIKKLDLLVNLLTIYPKIKAELSCFELPSAQSTYNLYFSIKKTEKAADYLVRKGIKRNRLILKGYGASFPLVTKPASPGQSPLYEKLNQRLEITPHNYETEPVQLHIENIKAPDNLLDPHGVKFAQLRNDLFYSVQIASITQILQNQAIDGIEEMFIEVDNAQGNYLYMVGLFATYEEADNMLMEMRAIGFPDAQIVPYFKGIRLSSKEIPELAKKYPDLLFYLAGNQNK